MYRFSTIFRKCGQSASILASIAVIGAHYWHRRNGGQNEAKEWTNTRLWPEFTLRNARLNGTEIRNNYNEWRKWAVYVTDTDTRTKDYGTGFIVENGAYVVAIAEDIQGLSAVSLCLSHGIYVDGKVIYVRPSVGLALIKLLTTTVALTVLPTKDIAVGERVVVLSAPAAKRRFVTGIIGCLGPTLNSYNMLMDPDLQYICHNMQCVNDFRGGPVLNMNGQVVGVMMSAIRDYYHILPAEVLNDFIQKGLEYETTAANVNAGPLERKNRYSFEGKARLGVMLRCGPNGFHVIKFTDNNANNNAGTGLQIGDQITHINQTAVEILPHLMEVLNSLTPGQSVNLTVMRGIVARDVTVQTLGLDFSIV